MLPAVYMVYVYTYMQGPVNVDSLLNVLYTYIHYASSGMMSPFQYHANENGQQSSSADGEVVGLQGTNASPL